MTGPRTVTVRLVDGETLTLTCPPWCTGHPDVETFRADVVHRGAELEVEVATNRGDVALITAALEHAPYSDIDTRDPYVSVRLGDGDHYRFTSPASLYGLAEDIAAKVRPVLRAAGDQLARVLDGEPPR